MLPAMGLTTPIGLTLTVLAIGAGSTVVSHANDSYFWVVSQFSDMDVSTAYRCQTLGTLVEGTAGMAMVAILALILL
jgi:GntP family gluconate:H+ symporter